MSNNKSREYQKALNYKTLYADGAIVHFGLDTCRIIFYTNETDIEEDGKKIVKDNDVALLRYEMVLPRSTLKHLAEETANLSKLEHLAIGIERRRHDANPKVVEAYWEFDKALQSLYFDTHKDLSNQNIREVVDRFNDLTAIAGLRKEEMEKVKAEFD